MRVLITGVTGFSGRHLAEHCAAEGDHVVGSGRLPAAPAGLDGYVPAELGDPEALRDAVDAAQPDVVFHLAAAASVARSWEDPRAALEVNVSGALNVLEAVRAAGRGAVVVVACSGEEYGPPERLPVGESHPLRPQNPYAVAKASVDLLAGLYADAHGLRVIRTRAFNHIGPGQSDTYVVSSFARQIAEAERRGEADVTVATGSTDTRRDFTDVRDVVRAYRLLAVRGEPGTFNVCSGRGTAITDILAGLAARTELRVEQRTDPSRVREHEVKDIHGTHDRLTDATGWRPEIVLDRTLEDTLAWWCAELAG